MLSVDTSELRRLERALHTARAKAIPHAVRNGLNRSAFAVREAWQDEVERSFVLRSPFAKRSILVDKANGNNVEGMKATVGSIAKFMAVQEQGGTVSKGKHKPIPTSYAAGQQGANPRTKLVRKGNVLSAITIGGKGQGTKQQRNAMAIRKARATGRPWALLETKRGKGLFRILGKQSKATREGMSKGSVRMVWDLSRKSVRIKPSRTLGLSLMRVRPRLPEIHRDAIIEQLRRHHVLGF